MYSSFWLRIEKHNSLCMGVKNISRDHLSDVVIDKSTTESDIPSSSGIFGTSAESRGKSIVFGDAISLDDGNGVGNVVWEIVGDKEKCGETNLDIDTVCFVDGKGRDVI
ncbi:unnamed protein product [Colias eurytheme]|nr:unnamed protein product [Colias eurytheme]